MKKTNVPKINDTTEKAPFPGPSSNSYSKAKEQLIQTVQRTECDPVSDVIPETAIEVIDERIGEHQPMKQAFIAEHLFRKTIEDAIPCGIAAFDDFGRQIYVNRTFCDMLGWDEQELMDGTYPYVYWASEDIERYAEQYSRLRRGDVPAAGLELPFLKKNEQKIWGWVLGSVIYDSDGSPAGHLIALMDISARKEAQERLRYLSTQLVDAQERERKLLSRDLHDSIGGRLAGIKYAMEKIVRMVPGKMNRILNALDDLLKVVKSTLEETQRISKNLHPSVLDDLGLMAALRDLVHEFRMLYPGIELSSKLEMEEGRIPEHLKILVYRVCQEALTNIGKHSRADRAVLRIELSGAEVILTIEDNGKGLPEHAVHWRPGQTRRSGLSNMRERTDLAGGGLDIYSESGKGVRIVAAWPIQWDHTD